MLHKLLEQAAKTCPDKTALICQDKSVTYQELNDRANVIAHRLLTYTTLGDRILIALPNGIEMVIAIYATLKAGAAFVIVNHQIKHQKLQQIVNNCKPRVIITSLNYSISLLSPDILSAKIECPLMLPDLKETIIEWSGTPITVPNLAMLIYTSGSTGEPKGVVTLHSNAIAAVNAVQEYLQLKQNDVIFNVLPFTYSYGLYHLFLAANVCATLVLEPPFMFAAYSVKRMHEVKATIFPLLSSIAGMILKDENAVKEYLTSLRIITCAGGPIPVKFTQRFRQLLPDTKIIPMYGLTECKRVSYLPPEAIDTKPDSVGIPISGCKVRIVDEFDADVPTGQVGELLVNGPHVMEGYWNAKAKTAAIFRKDEKGAVWLYTGDYFQMDAEGFLYFVSRVDDVIKVRNQRVTTTEIENILLSMPGIENIVITTKPDDMAGKLLFAHVVSTSEIIERDFFLFCKIHLEAHMIPTKIIFHQQIPLMQNGKVDKLLLTALT
ncbi:MAG: class I adenylate-forming enzyme family protein [Nitrosopumilaceae archaeon]